MKPPRFPTWSDVMFDLPLWVMPVALIGFVLGMLAGGLLALVMVFDRCFGGAIARGANVMAPGVWGLQIAWQYGLDDDDETDDDGSRDAPHATCRAPLAERWRRTARALMVRRLADRR